MLHTIWTKENKVKVHLRHRDPRRKSTKKNGYTTDVIQMWRHTATHATHNNAKNREDAPQQFIIMAKPLLKWIQTYAVPCIRSNFIKNLHIQVWYLRL